MSGDVKKLIVYYIGGDFLICFKGVTKVVRERVLKLSCFVSSVLQR